MHTVTDVSIWARSGEITAIFGDNGAVKSTLIKCISGVQTPSAGRIILGGEEVHFSSPEDARHAGIDTVYQNLALVDDLRIWQNMFLNRERVKRFGPFSFLDRGAMLRESNNMLSRLQVNIPDPNARVRCMSGGQRQAIAICRAASWGSRLVIMDEPTAATSARARLIYLLSLLR